MARRPSVRKVASDSHVGSARVGNVLKGQTLSTSKGVKMAKPKRGGVTFVKQHSKMTHVRSQVFGGGVDVVGYEMMGRRVAKELEGFAEAFQARDRLQAGGTADESRRHERGRSVSRAARS